MERRLRVEILVSAGEHRELEVFEGGKEPNQARKRRVACRTSQKQPSIMFIPS